MNPFIKIREKLSSIEANPSKISRGYALGVLLGTTPFIGTKVFIALILTWLLKWSKPASIIGVYHINALTGPVFYSAAFVVGKKLTGTQTEFFLSGDLSFRGFISAVTGTSEVFFALLAGGLALGIPMALMAYLASRVVLRNRKRGEQKPAI
ncbi:MAG TPA: DUF2062 domain-containing protein [Prolixibacteraceae bacterium]|nr:DUF2062 domain-containing protein [Prolixibacteraceae bacterium]HPT31279.1 DUF2062 domain-containing protein [Prolixibacteraceae bacterium]